MRALPLSPIVAVLALAATPARAHHLAEPAPFEKVLGEANRAYDRRAYADALAGFQTALGLATLSKNQIYVKLRLALCLRRMGRTLEARSALRALVEAHPRDIKAPRALYVAARIREADLGDRAGGEAELRALIDRYPGSDAAGRAVSRLAVMVADRGAEEAIELMRQIHRKYRRRAIGARAAYLAAGLYEERVKSPADALRLYELIIRRHAKTGFIDDALWKAAALHRKAKRPRVALRLYRRLAATRRESWSVGSYNSIYLDRAALETARVLLDEIGDTERGLEALREFVAEYPHSMRRAEARKLLVVTLAKLGRRAEAERELAILRRLFPKSRHTREAQSAVSGEKRS